MGQWFAFSFFATSAYGGTLRAFLLDPKLSSPIDTMKDMVNSGLPWKVVVYGDQVQSWQEEDQDPYMRTYWNDKIPVKTQDFPRDIVRNDDAISPMLKYLCY